MGKTITTQKWTWTIDGETYEDHGPTITLVSEPLFVLDFQTSVSEGGSVEFEPDSDAIAIVEMHP